MLSRKHPTLPKISIETANGKKFIKHPELILFLSKHNAEEHDS